MYPFVAMTAVVTLLLFLSGGCATTVPSHPHSALGKPPQTGKPGDIVETRSGKRISFEDLIEDLSHVRVIYAGEVHTSIEDHRIQQQLMEALHDRNPSLTLAMEMFPRKVQPVLDQWSTGMLKEEAFLEESNWKGNWGFPFRLYRGLLAGAKDRRMKVLALNAPHSVVRKIAQKGLSALTPEERSQIAADFEPDDPKHREYVREQYEQHAAGNIRDFESFYEAQLTWDETMAETIAQYLKSAPVQEQLLVILGNGHILHGAGVPQRAQRRFEHSYRTILPVPARSPDRRIDPEIADYVWVTEGKGFAHLRRGLLGIAVRPAPSGEGVDVMGVMPDSPAAKAGVLKGDRIYEINETPIHSAEDMHNIVAAENPGPAHRFRIKRGEEEMDVEIMLVPLPENDEE